MYALSLVALAAPALATIWTTNPIASTKHQAGEVLNIDWTDDGHAPALETIGVCSVDLCVGSVTQQTCVQNFGESVDVSKARSLAATIDPSVGANGDFYFIRYMSENYTEQGRNYLQFSARFTLEGMTGNFSAEAQKQIDEYEQSASASGSATAGPSATGGANATGPAKASPSVTGTALPNATTSANATKAPTSATSALTAPSQTPGSGAAARAVPAALALVAGAAAFFVM